METGSTEERTVDDAKLLDEMRSKLNDMALVVAVRGLDVLAHEFHAMSSAKGFWDGDVNPAEKLMLVVSEASEALEALRKTEPCNSQKIEGFSEEAEEIADLVIRVLDYAAGRGIPIGEAVLAKHKYNTTRPYKHNKKF